MSKFLTAPQWYDAGGGLNKSLDVNCNGSDTSTAFGNGANAKMDGVAIGNESSASGGVAVGKGARATVHSGSVAIGGGADANGTASDCIAIGQYAKCVVDSEPYRRIQFLNRTETFPSVVANSIGFCKKSLLDLIYPINSIYISVSSTDPGTIFGGTWEAFATGKTLVGVDANDTDFNAANKVGGSKKVTLDTTQIPEHSHYVSRQKAGESPTPSTDYVLAAVATTEIEGIETTSTGGRQPHDNMPPYITVYMWKRTA